MNKYKILSTPKNTIVLGRHPKVWASALSLPSDRLGKVALGIAALNAAFLVLVNSLESFPNDLNNPKAADKTHSLATTWAQPFVSLMGDLGARLFMNIAILGLPTHATVIALLPRLYDRVKELEKTIRQDEKLTEDFLFTDEKDMMALVAVSNVAQTYLSLMTLFVMLTTLASTKCASGESGSEEVADLAFTLDSLNITQNSGLEGSLGVNPLNIPQVDPLTQSLQGQGASPAKLTLFDTVRDIRLIKNGEPARASGVFQFWDSSDLAVGASHPPELDIVLGDVFSTQPLAPPSLSGPPVSLATSIDDEVIEAWLNIDARGDERGVNDSGSLYCSWGSEA